MKKTLALMAVMALTTAVAAQANDMSTADWNAKVDAKFDKMDTNNDGVVNQSEHTAASTAMFKDADGNNDQMISKEELRAFKTKEMKDWK